MQNPINRSYEKLVAEGGVGLDRGRFSTSTRRWAGPQCVRGGCHRRATRQWRARHWMQPWDLCDPCYDAIVSEVF